MASVEDNKDELEFKILKKAKNTVVRKTDNFVEGEPGSIMWLIRGTIEWVALMIQMANERMKMGSAQRARLRALKEDEELANSLGLSLTELDEIRRLEEEEQEMLRRGEI